MPYQENDRVRIRPLDGIAGTVKRVCGDGRYAVLADCAAQAVTWREDELEPAPALHAQFSSLNDD